jgi:hypothetical protein
MNLLVSEMSVIAVRCFVRQNLILKHHFSLSPIKEESERLSYLQNRSHPRDREEIGIQNQ